MAKRIVLAGGSGFLGQTLAHSLARGGYDIVVLTRNPAHYRGEGRAVHWDGRTQGDWARELDGAFAVINLTGKSVNCRYTPENRRGIIASRVDSVAALGTALAAAQVKPQVFIQAASAAIYGDAGETLCTESTPPAAGFSPEVCQAWERAFWQATPLLQSTTRTILLRIGFVLAPDGGALDMLAKLTRRGLGGTVGTGRQWMSWLHIADWLGIIRWALENPAADGLYNAVSPGPIRNADFMRELRRALHRPWSPPARAWAVRIGCKLMGTEPELALKGRFVVPARLTVEGYAFQFEHLRDALENIFPEGHLQPRCGHRAARLEVA